ncbi:secretion/DNA translocation related TadE-like protein [Microterricola gilva]|uniref:Secretion/DNA translocation related TadE-like protein n=1 Tax=Microterricola gilva TaxID=393267 RepID=A0A4Q8AQE7_9MICO|nr:Rv3654c family TadE-like protein [Microterricola gilva]RZU66285.1 secretion/DNA translocation related TadE-like protein [Microterricola gilva]
MTGRGRHRFGSLPPGDRGDRGSGTVLTLAVLGATVGVVLTLIPVTGAFVASQRAANAADAAALAAADVASGAVPGVACQLATVAASLNGAVLDGCELNGAVALVSVSTSWWVFSLSASARAGPPGTP